MVVLAIIVVGVALLGTVTAVRLFDQRKRLGELDAMFDAAVAEAAANPLPPMACPACSCTDIERVAGGLWDGFDPTTMERVGGTNDFGVCRRCQTRVARWNDSPCYTPADEEWQAWALHLPSVGEVLHRTDR
jgi:hypothetical protein